MAKKKPNSTQRGYGPQDAAEHPVREYITYLLGGIIAFGLIGWFAGMALGRSWLLFAGAGFGAVAGLYIAWRHHVDRRREAGRLK